MFSVMRLLKNRLFLATVFVPTLLASVYFGLIASDVYVCESRFVVRSPERPIASPLGALLKSGGFARSQDDSYTVQDYVQSRDALKQLEKRVGIRRAYSSRDIDPLSRFAWLDRDDSFEGLYRYYRKKLEVQLDSMSSITTLTVRTFNADDAYRINEYLLEMSEALVNQLNQRGREDLLRLAMAEVDRAERRVKAAGLALSEYRNREGVMDPEKQSAIQLQQIARLQEEMLSTTTQLAQLHTFTKDNPQIPALEKRREVLQAEMDNESRHVTGGKLSLSNKAADYQRLILEREFADKQLGAALASLEQARTDAQSKQLYLERIVQPNKPDSAWEPHRLRAIAAVFVLGMITWGILTVLIAGIREHQD